MRRIDDPSAVAALPTPEAAGTEGYFTEGSPGVTNPTLVRASWLNMIQEELRAVVVAGGLTPSKTTYNQVMTAIMTMIDAQSGNYCLDTGVANASVIALNPPITAYVNGMTARFRVKFANTTACTLDAGAGAIPLLNDLGGALVSGDLLAGFVVTATYDNTAAAFLINSMLPSQALTQTQADARYAAIAAGLKFGGTPGITVTTTHTIANIGGKFLAVNSATPTTQTLPLASTATPGQAVGFTNLGAGLATFARQGSDNLFGGLSGTTSFALNQNESFIAVCDGGANWHVLFANGAVGLAPQTLQNVAASRTVGGANTNSTSRMIWVMVSMSTSTNAAIVATVDGLTLRGSSVTTTSGIDSITFPVLPGKNYSVTTDNGTATVNTWIELR